MNSSYKPNSEQIIFVVDGKTVGIVDDKEFLEFHRHFAKNIIVGFF